MCPFWFICSLQTLFKRFCLRHKPGARLFGANSGLGHTETLGYSLQCTNLLHTKSLCGPCYCALNVLQCAFTYCSQSALRSLQCVVAESKRPIRTWPMSCYPYKKAPTPTFTFAVFHGNDPLPFSQPIPAPVTLGSTERQLHQSPLVFWYGCTRQF